MRWFHVIFTEKDESKFAYGIFKLCIVIYTQCGKNGNLLSHFFGKNFVKATFLLKKLLNSWYDEIFWWECRVNFSITTLVWKNEKFTATPQFFSVKSIYSKTLISWNFCEKWWEWIHSAVWKDEKIFRQINSLVISLVKPLLSRNFCQKSVKVNHRNFHTVQWSNYIRCIQVWRSIRFFFMWA